VTIDCHVALTLRKRNNPEVEVLLGAMQAHGIDKAVIVPVCPGTGEEEMVRINDSVHTEAIGYYAIEGFATVNPRSPAAQEELDRAVRELGLKGLSIDPAVQGFRFGDDEFWSLMEVVNSLGVPVFCRSARSEFFVTEEINETVISFPEVPFIFTQMGLESPGGKFSKLFGEGNVYFETSRVPPAYLMEAVKEYGAGRLVFGSGYRGGQYPAEELEKLQAMDISEEEREAVLGGNISRLLGLSPLAEKGRSRLRGILEGLPFFRK